MFHIRRDLDKVMQHPRDLSISRAMPCDSLRALPPSLGHVHFRLYVM